MNLQNQPPLFVPSQYQKEIEKLSKAALMDIVWDLAKQNTRSYDDGREAPEEEVMTVLRSAAEIICLHRKHAKVAA